MLDNTAILTLSDKATFRSLGDRGVILMVDSGQLYSCNETAEAFLRRVDGLRTLEEIASDFSEEFEVSSDELLGDLNELIAFLISEGVFYPSKNAD